MLEIARLDGGSDCFELDFAERESTPESALKLGIRDPIWLDYHFQIPSLFSIGWCRTLSFDHSQRGTES